MCLADAAAKIWNREIIMDSGISFPANSLCAKEELSSLEGGLKGFPGQIKKLWMSPVRLKDQVYMRNSQRSLDLLVNLQSPAGCVTFTHQGQAPFSTQRHDFI
jgi:hypothetical protein